eukprot:m.232003 g.232003  ORF g.232003 m.232003 type:complete len:483 (+) comp15704_c0_seq1:369-1817(+)
MAGADAALNIETPRTWLQFNELFDAGLRGTQLAWLNCRIHLSDLYYEDTDSVRSMLTSKEVLEGLTKAMARTDPKSDNPMRVSKKMAFAKASTTASMKTIVAVLEDFKKMPPPRPSALHPEKITFTVLGRTNVGKTSFVNALTGLDLDTSVKGRMTTQLEPQLGKWFHADGRVWEFEIIDTPGVDDSYEQDKATFDQLEAEFTDRGNINAVFLVCNGQAPVLDLPLLKAVKKYHDRIFGDCLLKNWGLVYNKWFMDPASVDSRDEDAEEMLIDGAQKAFQTTNLDGPGTPLGIIPARVFFQDCLPDRRVADTHGVRELFSRIDDLFDWMSTRDPIQTKVFRSLEQSKQQHILNIQKLRPWFNETFTAAASDDLTTVKLSRSNMRVAKTVVSKVLTLGLAAKYYDVKSIHLQFGDDLAERETKVKYLGQGTTTLTDLFDRLGAFGDCYVVELATEEDTEKAEGGWRHDRVRSYKCRMKFFRRS